MVFYILMAVGIGGGFAWMILDKFLANKTLGARQAAWDKKHAGTHRCYHSYCPSRPVHQGFNWGIPGLSVFVASLLSLIGTQVFTERAVYEEVSYPLVEMADDVYLETQISPNSGCKMVTYKLQEDTYWSESDSICVTHSTISEGAEEPTVNVTTYHWRTAPWFSPWGGPLMSQRENIYDFQVPTGTVTIK